MSQRLEHLQSGDGRDALRFVATRLPQLAPFLDDLLPFSLGERGEGGATHPQAVQEEWLRFVGGQHFLVDPTVPDGFRAIGVRSGGTAEYVFAMWRVGERRFWFEDQFRDLCHGGAYAEVRSELGAALTRWTQGEQQVGAAGGWTVLATG